MPVRAQFALLLAFAMFRADAVWALQQPPVPIPPGFGPRVDPAQQQQQQQTQQPAPQQTKPAGQAPAAQAAPSAISQANLPSSFGGLNLQNVALAEVIDFLARQLKLNYILDPRVGGRGVTINTYGELKDLDPRALLDLILRINGAAMVQTGSLYRIVPLADLAKLPLKPEVDQNNIPEDDRPMLNLIFLKYVAVEETAKLIEQFLGAEGRIWAYPPANLLLVLDSRRNMKRTMDLVSMFDSDALAKQRVRLFDTQYSRPSDLAKELENLLKTIALSKENAAIKFIPVDRINILIAVAPNPGAFQQVEEWIKRLDVKVTGASGKVETYVYRVKYQRAEMLAGAIMMLYMSMYSPYGGMGMMGGYGMGMMGGYGGGMMGGYGGGMGGFGGGGMMGGYGGGMGMMGGGGGMIPGMGMQQPLLTPGMMSQGNIAAAGGGAVAPPTGTIPAGNNADGTGAYLGAAGAMTMQPSHPRIVPNPMDNSLLILATSEEYEGITKMLRELDVSPRQVLIEAKIYEVSLTGAFKFGIDYYLRQIGAAPPSSGNGGGTTLPNTRQLVGTLTGTGGLVLSAGMLVGASRELMALLTAQETEGRTRAVATPSIIATDSIPASINVGLEVPTLSSQAVTGAISGGNSLFANTIQNRATGVTLNIVARVNPSGVVTLVINQDVSAPQAPALDAIQSPSFSRRSVATQVTMQDGDTIAIGGIISEQDNSTTGGLPGFHKLPVVGPLFGAKSSNKQRTELVIFLTPRVIYDANELNDATDELISRMKRLQRQIRP